LGWASLPFVTRTLGLGHIGDRLGLELIQGAIGGVDMQQGVTELVRERLDPVRRREIHLDANAPKRLRAVTVRLAEHVVLDV
jgi:hypothetical protein